MILPTRINPLKIQKCGVGGIVLGVVNGERRIVGGLGLGGAAPGLRGGASAPVFVFASKLVLPCRPASLLIDLLRQWS